MLTPATVVNKAEKREMSAKVAKNSVAMLAVATITKAAGLAVAVLIARYLGPSGLGIYAAVMGLAELLEITATLGHRYVVIRQVARNPSRLIAYYVNASLTVCVSSLVLGGALVLSAHLFEIDANIRGPVYIVAVYLPLAGLTFVARAALQGLEQMECLAIADVAGRGVDLLTLWLLLHGGAGVAAAFVGRALYQLTALLVLSRFLLEQRWATVRVVRPDYGLCMAMIRSAIPFIFHDFMNVALSRINALSLPLLFALSAVGIFDAADRVGQTTAMVIPMISLAVLPTLSRTYVTDRVNSVTLLEGVLKLVLALILPFAFLIAVSAHQIVPLLYGPGYEAAIPVMRVVIWASVFFVFDSVLNQLMMASNNERPMVKRTALSLTVNMILILVLAPRFGPVGAAWAVVATRALNLSLDVHFVVRNVTRLGLVDSVGKPLLCALLSGCLAFVLQRQGLYLLMTAAGVSYVGFLLVFRVFSREDLVTLQHFASRTWRKVAALRR